MRYFLAFFLTVLMPVAWGASPENNSKIDVKIQEWQVPWEKSRPRDPSVAANGDVWFVGQGDDYLARFKPDAEEFHRIDLPEGTGPHNVIVGPDQRLWVAGNRNARIIRVTPKDEKQKTYKTPDSEGDPHTQQFGPDGMLWFTLQHHNSIGRLDTKSGKFKIKPVPTEGARPYGLRIAEDGVIWVAEFGSHKLLRIDPANFKMKEFRLKRKNARPRRLAIGDEGGIWYVDYAQGYLGRLDAETGEQREWRAPSGKKSQPYAMTKDTKGRLWFVETGPNPNVLVGFDPATKKYIAKVPIASGGGAVRHMVYDAERNSIWFGTDTNTLGQARLPE